MQKHLNILKTTRLNLLKLVEGLSMEDLNKIPENFNNNLLWNLGHIVVTQQLLCYKLANVPCRVSEEMINKYRKGSKPEGFIDEAELIYIKELMLTLVESTREDIGKGLFHSYKSYRTSYNVELNSFEEALFFNNVHEGLHYGYCMALLKVL